MAEQVGVPEVYPDGNGSEDELDEPDAMIEQPDQELPEIQPRPESADIEEHAAPDSSGQVRDASRAIPPPLDHLHSVSAVHTAQFVRQQHQRGTTMPTRIPTTPGIMTTGGNDDEDGCVPRTPTLLSGRGQHDGNQALVSPAPQLQQPGRAFHFFGDTADNDHSVPGTTIAQP